jgi:microcystin-dependent protein
VAFIGEIRPFAGPLPRGWLSCDGQLLEIQNHQALYSLIGTTYGGDGKKTFALPDLRGRVTAGTDHRKAQDVGATSGRSGESESLIPFAVIRWGIALEGRFPAP